MTSSFRWWQLLKGRLGAVAICFFLDGALQARTIVLTDEDCEQIAVISSGAPRLSWAAFENGEGAFSTFYIDLYSHKSFLIRYPLDKVPKGQKITNAEWTLPINYYIPGGEQRLHIRRILAEWGAGICHEYRMTRPKKVHWNTPGGRGISTDRAAKPSAVVRLTSAEEQVVNVTEDVELWYGQAAVNHGWMVTVDDTGVLVRLGTPLGGGRGTWKLRITYEPSDDK